MLFVKYFNTIPLHSLSSLIILHHSSLSYIIPYNLTSFNIIQHHSTLFPIILQHSPLFSLFLHHSPTFDKSTLFFYNIFRQHFFSTTFPNIRQNHFSTRNFCHLLSNKKLVVCCIINMILSVYYYQLNIINILLSIS